MSEFRVELTAHSSWWLFAASLLIALGLVFYFYRVHAGTLDKRRLWGMLVLRLLAVAMLVSLLFQPVASYERRRTAKDRMAVAVDASRSMCIRDYPTMPDRLQRAKSTLIGVLDELEDDFDLTMWSFGARARKLDGKGELLDAEPRGESTNVGAAVGQMVRAERPSSVLLLSDGIDNSGSDPAREAAPLGVRVYTVGVGTKLMQEKEFRDIVLSDVQTKRFASVNSVTGIRVLVDSVGFKGNVAKVAVVELDEENEPGEELGRAEVVLDGIVGDQEITVRITSRKKGTLRLRASVPPEPTERIRVNNSQDFCLRVTEPRVKVLYVEGAVRPESKYLKRVLSLDPGIECLSLTKVKKGVFVQHGKVEDLKLMGFPGSLKVLKEFDVVILGDIDSSHFTGAQFGNLRAMVEDGGGMLLLWGQSGLNAGGYGETPLSEILPAELGRRNSKVEKTEFALTLTSDGKSHPVLTGLVELFEGGDLSGLQFLNVAMRARPTAQVLAVHPSRKNEFGPLVVFAVMEAGKGRTAVFCAGPTWRWWFRKALGKESPYTKLWGQLVRWLASEDVLGRSSGPGVTAYLDDALYSPGEVVSIFAYVRDAAGQLTSSADVAAHVTEPSGKESTIRLGSGGTGAGEYEASYAPREPGIHGMAVRASEAAKDLGECRLEFRVGKPNLELERFDLDDKLLSGVAEATGGRYTPLEGLRSLVERFKAEERKKREYVRLDPWSGNWMWPFFLLFVALLAGEWIVRRQSQLS